MRPENIVDRERRAVEELAAEYEEQGYNVLRVPSLSDTPESLRPYQPDLIATKGAEKWVVEVKVRGLKRQEGFWAGLAEKVAKSGWRFRIVIAEGAESDPRSYEMPGAAEIEAALASPAKLVAQEQGAAALMLGWSLFEAAARQRLLRDDQDPGRAVTPVGLAKVLVQFGHLDESEFDKVRKILSLRNQAAHGLFDVTVPPGTIEFLATLTRSMLADEQAT